MKTTKTYEIGDDSRLFLKALDTFQQFKDDFLAALTNQYGEEQGTKMFLSHSEQHDDVERGVMDYLRVQFSMQMGTDAERVVL